MVGDTYSQSWCYICYRDQVMDITEGLVFKVSLYLDQTPMDKNILLVTSLLQLLMGETIFVEHNKLRYKVPCSVQIL